MEMKKVKFNGAKAIVLSSALMFGATGCQTRENNIESTSSIIETSIIDNTTEEVVVTETEKVVEPTTEEVIETTESVVENVEDTTEFVEEDFLSIDNMDSKYNLYKDYYENHGIDEQEFYNMNYVLNDKLVDDEGKLIMSVEDVWTAYSNLSNLINVPEISQKIDNINAKAYGIDLNDNIIIPEIPKVSEMINPETKDAKFAISKLEEFEEFRDNLINDLNNKSDYDKEAIKEYVIKLNVTDVNSGNAYAQRVNSNSLTYVLADVNINALQLAAMAYNQYEYLDINVDGVKGLKINPTNGESDIENAVNQLLEQGWINEATLSDALAYYTYSVALNKEVDTVEISERLGVSIDQANLLLAYVQYRTKMAITSHIQTECNAEARTVTEVQEMENTIRNKYTKVLR